MNLFKHIKPLFYTDRCPYCNHTINHNEKACQSCAKEFPEYSPTRFAKGGYYCYSPFTYKGKFKSAVKKMKFNKHPEYSEKLVIPIADTLKRKALDVDFDFIAYVPMHKAKLNERGYNQAQLLAKELGKIINLPCKDVLLKTKENKEQHKCKKEERKKNVRGVYEANNKDNIKDRNILLVDDIITSGYTLGECCKVLKRSGANEIYCVTVCAVN